MDRHTSNITGEIQELTKQVVDNEAIETMVEDSYVIFNDKVNSHFNDLCKSMRKVLIEQTTLPGDRIANALSVRGADIIKYINEFESESPTLLDTFIIFEVLESDEPYAYGGTDNETKVETIVSYDCKLKIYGSLCHDVARTLLGRMKSVEPILKLQDNNIWVYGVNKIGSINELINNTVYPRCDMVIRFVDSYIEDKITIAEDTASFGNISIKKF